MTCPQGDGTGVGSMTWVGPAPGNWRLDPCTACEVCAVKHPDYAAAIPCSRPRGHEGPHAGHRRTGRGAAQTEQGERCQAWEIGTGEQCTHPSGHRGFHSGRGSYNRYPPCPNHDEVQHRDGRPPWCPHCGWNHGQPAVPARQIKELGGSDA